MKKLIYKLVLVLILNSAFLIPNCYSQWQPDVRLTNNTYNSYTSLNNAWCVASSGSVVHVVWYDDRDGNEEIYYKRSTDGGVSWGADIRLTNSIGNSRTPSVAVSGSIVHVVWHDRRDGNMEIYYKRSADGGLNWGADIRLTNNTSVKSWPTVAVSGSVVHVVWPDDRDAGYEIYYKRSADGGISWGADTRLTHDPYYAYPSVANSISVSGSIVHVVWKDYRDGNDEIYYKRSIDAGVSWGTDIRLTNTTVYQYSPSVAVSGSVVHVVWYNKRDGNLEIYYKRSTDAGVNWGTDIRLTNNTASSEYPSVAASGMVVHVVWFDKRDGELKRQVYYKRSTDGGLTWGADTRLTDNIADSWNPSVAVSGSVVHVVWSDYHFGWEIYYKRNPTGNVGIQNISSEIPSSYSLGQNYPNPFNPRTNIRFQIMRSPTGAFGDDKVMLKVYDVMGREVATLVNEKLQPGTYQVDWDGSSFASGVYYYKLMTGNFAETKKMILIK